MDTLSITEGMDSFAPFDTKTCNQLLGNSNELYRYMLNNLIAIADTPEAATPQQLQTRLLQFNELQQRIEDYDQLLHEALGKIAEPDEEMKQLLDERRELIERLLQQNRKVSMQAQAIKSVLADEIRKCAAGHVAMKGYRTSDQQQNSGTFRKAM